MRYAKKNPLPEDEPVPRHAFEKKAEF